MNPQFNSRFPFHLILLTLAILALPASLIEQEARADGKVFVPRDYQGSLEESSQEGILIFHGGENGQRAKEDLILKISVKGTGDLKRFGWVVPFPTAPETFQEDPALFKELFQYVQARLAQSAQRESRERPLAKSAAPKMEEGVTVLSRKEVGSFDVAVVQEKEAGALNRWLEQEGFKTLGQAAEEVLGFYRRKNYCYACIKVNDAALERGAADLHPLRFTFTTGGRDGIYFPMKLTGLQSEPFGVSLYVFYKAWINGNLNRYGYNHRGFALRHRDWDGPNCTPNAGKSWSAPGQDPFLQDLAPRLPTVTRLFQKLHPGEKYYLTNIYAQNLKPVDVRGWSDDLWLFPYYTDKSFVPYDARAGKVAAEAWQNSQSNEDSRDEDLAPAMASSDEAAGGFGIFKWILGLAAVVLALIGLRAIKQNRTHRTDRTNRVNNGSEPEVPAALRREKALAFQLGALEDPNEIAQIQDRLSNDPAWRQAGIEAQAMLQGLTEDGAADSSVPEGLSARTARRLQEASASEKPRIQESKIDNRHGQASTLQSPIYAHSFFTPRVAAAIFFLCALPALWYALRYTSLAPERESIFWRAESQLASGAPFAPNLLVRDSQTKAPLEGVHLTATLGSKSGDDFKTHSMGEGVTGPAGVLTGAAWRVPEVPPGEYRLSVTAQSSSGRVLDHAEQLVQVSNDIRLALAPDRLQARPGEKIRARALLVSSGGERPKAEEPVTLDLFDPTGNRIGRRETRSSSFGLAWSEFPLDSEAPEGDYKLLAESGGLKAERTVAVKQYRLPPFRVRIDPGQAWFGERDAIRGRLEAQTFDGHAVARAKGEIQALDLRGKVLQRAEITLDEQGRSAFTLPATANFLAKENLQPLRLEAQFTDPAGRTASGECLVNVSRHALLVSAVPESGELVQGVENRVYLVVRKPDGTPVRATLQVSRQGGQDDAQPLPTPVETDARGAGIFALAAPKAPAEVLQIYVKGEKIPPPAVTLAVRPADSQPGRSKDVGRLLVRPEKAVLRAGESFNATVLAGALPKEGTLVNLALRQNGRTLATSGVTLPSSGKETVQVTIPDGVAGMLTLEASLTLPNGTIWTDRRAILVNGSANLKLAAQAEGAKETYLPGEHARVHFRVTNQGGQGVPAAVSVVGVDRALLALSGENPGLAQALAKAGMRTSSIPGFPLTPASFLPEEGNQTAALAAMAAVLPREEKEGQERGEPGVIDTAGAKIAAYNQAHAENRNLLRQWALGLAGIGIALLMLVWANGGPWERRPNKFAVPLVTLVLGVASVLGFAILRLSNPVVFIIILYATLVVSHAMLLWPRSNAVEGSITVPNSRLLAVTILSDFILALLAFVAIMRGMSGLAGGFSILFGVSTVIAALFQYFGCLEGLVRKIKLSLENRLLLFVGGIFAAFTFVFIVFVLPQTEVMNRISGGDSKSGGGALRVLTATAEKMEAPKSASEPMAMTPAAPELAAAPTKPLLTEDAQASPPYLRWDFPETLIFAPQVITDEKGDATLEVPLADSLTEWRLQADGIAASGGTAWTECGLTVTQPFSVDLTLPTGVTAGDTLSVPAVVSNHTDAARKVTLTLDLQGAQALDGLTREFTVEAKSVAAAEFSLRFEKSGTATLHLEAKADPLPDTPPGRGKELEGDAVQRTLTVIPEGRPVGFAASSLVQQDGELQVEVPEAALPGTIHARLTIHRGPLTQMLEGLESMLQEPHGCFEQTSSTNYPNVMVLRYLKANGIQDPKIQARAETFLAHGYQRLIGFEVGGRSGSFSLFGQAPANLWLTAYGLKQFTAMAAVYPVEPALLARIRSWLNTQMKGDGSFAPDPSHGVGSHNPLATTAYVVWALGDQAPRQSVNFLSTHVPEIEKDGYLCAITANALLPHDRATAQHLAGKLSGLAQITGEKPRTASLPVTATLGWGYGNTAAVQANALAVLALLDGGQNMEAARLFLASLHQHATNGGGWGSTHATVLALQALERAASVGRAAGPARVVVEVDGQPLAPIALPAEEATAPFAVPMELKPGISRLRVRVEGGPVAVRVDGTYHLPWNQAAPNAQTPLQARVRFDATTLSRGQAVLGTLELSSKGRKAEIPMVEWGLPAGFDPETAGLDDLKAKGTLSRWERSGRLLRLYFPDLSADQNVRLAVRFFASAKGQLQGQAGRAYEYYRRDEGEAVKPGIFTVK